MMGGLTMLSLAIASLLKFRDVPATSWAFPDVTMLASAGVLRGETLGAFRPTLPVTREQAGATLARLLALPAATLPLVRDGASISPTLRADLARAVAAGILRGTTTGLLEPWAPLSRAAAAALIARAFHVPAAKGRPPFLDAGAIPAYATGYVTALHADGIVDGDAQGDFLPRRDVTRAEWAALLLRAIAALGGAQGTPQIVAGDLSSVYPPANPALAASSPLGGEAGALGVGGRTLDLAPGALVYRGAEAADLYALSAGDAVAVFLARDGTSPLVVDLRPAAANALAGAVADLSAQDLYLDTGAVLPVASGASLTYQGQSLKVASWPSYLLWSQVKAEAAPLTLQVTAPYAFDLAGTVTAVGAQGFTLRLTGASALSPLVPALAAGDAVQVDLSSTTVVAGLGANGPTAPAAGLTAEVQGAVQPDGSIAADHVALSR